MSSQVDCRASFTLNDKHVSLCSVFFYCCGKQSGACPQVAPVKENNPLCVFSAVQGGSGAFCLSYARGRQIHSTVMGSYLNKALRTNRRHTTITIFVISLKFTTIKPNIASMITPSCEGLEMTAASGCQTGLNARIICSRHSRTTARRS